MALENTEEVEELSVKIADDHNRRLNVQDNFLGFEYSGYLIENGDHKINRDAREMHFHSAGDVIVDGVLEAVGECVEYLSDFLSL